MVEEARLESVYTSKAYRGFESPSLRSKSPASRKTYRAFILAVSQAQLKIYSLKCNMILKKYYLYGVVWEQTTSKRTTKL